MAKKSKNGRRYASLYERLVANTVVDEQHGCWIWTGPVDNHYPRVTVRLPGVPHPVKVQAHRAMLELSTGYYFPFDEAGHYRCFNPLCIHPDHLRIETPAENLSTRRGYAPCEGRWIPVLFPTPERLMDESINWDRPTEESVTCPF